MFTDVLLITLLCQVAGHQAQTQPVTDISAAVRTLRDPAAPARAKIEACHSLALAGRAAQESSIDLIRAARDDGPVHKIAMVALIAVEPDAVDHLMALLRQRGDDANAAADALADMGWRARRAVGELRAMLEANDFGVCRRALTVIQGLGPIAADAAPQLQRLMCHPAWEVRYPATTALLAVTTRAKADQRRAVLALLRTPANLARR